MIRRQVKPPFPGHLGPPSLARYALLTIGFIAILQSAGIDLSTLTVFAGALGVGIGFGLQNIAGNFISGLIILFERPIKVGTASRPVVSWVMWSTSQPVRPRS